jgi:hypothetical protein
VIYWPTKTPDAEIDYGADWAPTLSRVGDATIADSDWTRLSGDAVIGVASFTDTETSVRISAGTDGIDSIFENTVTLSDGQILTEKAYLKVRA